MTLRLFLQLWPACVIATLLLVDLSFPAAPLRTWLAKGTHVATLPTQPDGPWFVVDEDEPEAEPYPTYREAVKELTWPQRFRAWVSELVSCYWCTSAWVALVGTAVFTEGDVWFRLSWVPAVWLASAGTAVVLNAVSER